jgi:FdhE protein
VADQGLAFDLEAAAQLFRQLAQAVEGALREPASRHLPVSTAAGSKASPVSAIYQATRRGRVDLPELWRALATGDAAALESLAARASLDAQWLRLLGENTLQPALRALQTAVSRAVSVSDWQQGMCPVCGGLPFLAEVQGKEGARHLRCGLCAAGWPYARVKCAYCANTEHLTLGTLSLEGEADKYRVQTCDVCHGYVKVVMTFDPIAEDLLAVEDLATYHLDLIAIERGYSRAPVTA